MELTKDYLHTLFEYLDGDLYWKIKPNKNTSIGDKAGYIRADNYRFITIEYKKYRAHALVYLFHYGIYPKMLDHIDGNPSNNLISNLRVCSAKENNRNTRLRSNNTSGHKGVSWYVPTKRWRVQITLDTGKFVRYFKDKEEAIKYSIALREEHHKEYARHE